MKMITRLAISNNKKNKTRSILIVLSIFLTTVLLSAIATFGYGNIKISENQRTGILRILLWLLCGRHRGTNPGDAKEK